MSLIAKLTAMKEVLLIVDQKLYQSTIGENPTQAWKDAQTIQEAIDEIRSLQEDSDFLAELEAQGVDNWQGYEIAQEAMRHG